MKHIGLGVLVGAIAGWAAGALESAFVAATTELAFQAPLIESFQVAFRYALVGALVGLVLALVPKLLRPRGVAALAAVSFAVVAFLIGGSWIHQVVLGKSSVLSGRSLLYTGGLAAACIALGFGLATMRAGIGALFVLAVGGHAGVLAFAGGASSGELVERNAPPEGAPNVLFVLIDTLRADHLSCYGYGKPTSPVMDRIASEGVRFDAAYAQATWTRPSVASLFTSVYPASHLTNELEVRVPASFQTLAETMQAAGYRTACFSANRNVDRVFGFDQGFDHFWAHTGRGNELVRFTAYDRVRDMLVNRFGIGRKTSSLAGSDAATVTDLVLAWAAEQGDEPYFLYVQYLDPHGPYAPPASFMEEIGLELDAKTVMQQVGGMHTEPPFPFGEWPQVDEELLGQVRQLYDAEIRFCDRELGRLLDGLQQRGMLDDTYIVVTSDHGEEFYEHKQFGHGQSMFDELARVPLLVKGPGVVPGVTSSPVELIDLYPTIAGWAGAQVPEKIHGRDLRSILTGGSHDSFKDALAQNIKESPLTSLRVGNEKLIEVEHQGETRWMLFDLASDPLEQNDLSAERAARVEEMRNALMILRMNAEAYQAEDVERVEIDRETAEHLNELGYGEEDEEGDPE